MVHLIDKNDSGFQSTFCHTIIQHRHAFLIDNHLPAITSTQYFPSSHLPVNLINSINDTIFTNISSKLFPLMANCFEVDTDELSLHTLYYVVNGYDANSVYTDVNYRDYSYCFVILLNEKTYYKGGEVLIDSSILDFDCVNDMVCFSLNEKFNIRDIYMGEQHKLIGYVNNKRLQKLSADFNSQNSMLVQNSLGICLHKQHVVHIGKLFDMTFIDDFCTFLQSTKDMSVDNDDVDITLNDLMYIRHIEMINHRISTQIQLGMVLKNYNICLHNVIDTNYIIRKSPSSLTYCKPRTISFQNDSFETKLSLFVSLNEFECVFVFPNYNLRIPLQSGEGILVPNGFLYSFTIEHIHKKGITNSQTFLQFLCIEYY